MTDIPRAPSASRGAELPVSFAQEQVWFIDEFNSDSPMHNLPFLVRLRGPLDVAALSRALASLEARHEPLRTRLPAGRDGRPVQVIDPPGPVELELEDLSELDDPDTQLAELAVTAGARPIQFARDRLLSASLMRLADAEHALLVVAHQTGFDDGSLGVFVRELAALYQEETGGAPARLPELPVRFADYVLWERDRLQGQVLADLEAYWQAVLAGFETSQFPADRPRPRLASHAGAVRARWLDPELLAGLRERGGTLAETLLTALHVLLSRYTGQTDLVIGAVSGNRDRPELAPLIGLLANPVPVRADLSGDPPFTELLSRVRAAMSGGRAHQDLPFAKIVETLRLDRDTGRWPVYQVAFACPDPVPAVEAAGVVFQAETAERRAARYDIEFVVRAGAEGLRIEATYAPALFDAGTVERLLGHFEVVLRGVVADPGARLSELPVLTDAELHRELAEWNDTALELPVTCIHQGFEAQAAAAPGAVAAEFEDQRLSYAELDRQANRIARRLRELGVGPGVLAGVCLRTGLDRLAALLGIWKAGGGYVPLDPAAPAARLEYMIADTGMAVLLTDDTSAASLPADVVVNLDAERELIGALDDGPLTGTGVTPASVAYVIYTSGSTGQPKGVVVEHRQAINFLHGMTRAWHIGPGSAVLSFAAVTFDVSVMDMFMPLLAGARVVLAAPQTLHSPPRLAALIRDRHITFACLPPAVLTLLTGQDFPQLRTLLSAGEELTSELLRAWLRPGLDIYNGYGPTEASIGATFMKLEPTTPLPPPIGRPKPNYQAYILDTHLNPVPVGVTGELHIGGAGVARGYLNQPDLTRQQFIPDPFTPGGRLYKTGDLARRRPDGTIAFHGRADNQVKIRGLRVELGEIETALLTHPGVAQATVTVIRDLAGQPQLAGYLRPSEHSTPTAAEIRHHLGQRLPAYMIPSYLTILTEIPLTPHGKIDKTALPPPQPDTASTAQVPPRTLLEVLLADLYAGVLGTEQVGAADSFFDAGGSSLQAMQLVTQLREHLAVDLDVAAVFLAPAPQQLAALLRDKHGFDDEELADLGDGARLLTDSERATLAARLRRGPESRPSRGSEIPRRPEGLTKLPPSYGQEQLWFIDRFAPGEAAYNIPHALRLSGPLDTAALGRALDALIARHEALRTRLVADPDGRPVQVIDPPRAGTLTDLTDLTGLDPDRRQVRLAELIEAAALRPFALAEGPLLRTELLRLAPGEHVLTVVVHHAVFDGWSAGVLVHELAVLYRQEAGGEPARLPDLPVQFADYARWERDRLQGPVLAELEDYWRTTMDGFETVQFPTDRPRPVLDNFDGRIVKHLAGTDLLHGLRELSRREGTTLFVTLMAGMNALLARYTGQDDLVVGTFSASRSRPDLTPLIGFLVNTLPIRTDLSGDPEFTQLLGRVREAVVGAFAHQDLPFGKLVDALRVERDPSRAPVFQIDLVYVERDTAPVTAAGVEIALTDLIVGIDPAKFDLGFLVEPRPGGLWLECSYKTGLFDADTVARLLANFEVLLRGAVADPSARLSELPVLTEAERHAELVTWNDTAGEVPAIGTHEGFAAQAARTPDGVAAEYEGTELSYGDLNRHASQIGRRLRELGVGPEMLVGVCMQPGLTRLAALLGIWKAGGGYVPLDPALPADRLTFMITDTQLRVILTDPASTASLPASTTGHPGPITLVDLETERRRVAALDDSELESTASPENVAYVIYTSGSTGSPKGVVVEHRHLVNLLHAAIRHWDIGPGDAVLQFASLSFDVSVRDMFTPLLSGGRVVLAPASTLHSPPRLAALMRDRRVTFACLTPAVISLLGDGEFPALRMLLSGGEELPSELARRWTGRPGLRFVNGYGPTEVTISATFMELDAGTQLPPPIGRPLRPNYQAYVLDKHLNPVPVGVTGELHLGGASVARGYLNRPELTRERFIPDPFRDEPGARLYKTGDLVRRRADGTIVFLGRADGQMKLRGLRIELGEIETALATHPAIAQAVVTVVTDPAGVQQLAAYVRPEPGAAPDLAPVRAHLARTLPGYMIPAHLITVDAFPLNSSGKIDKSALPPPQAAAAGTADAPATLIETMMADLYARLLGRDQVGATDSFFDLGGNSLQAMRLVTMMDSELDVDLNVAAVFLSPTPRQLAALLRDDYQFEDAPLGADDLDVLAGLG